MVRILALLYGVGCYLIFAAAGLYAASFLTNRLVPHASDQDPPSSSLEAWLVDILLIGLFGLQHSVMARTGFKRWWTWLVPEVIERGTYVLASSVVLGLVFWQWRPIPGDIWTIEHPLASLVINGLAGAAAGLMAWASIQIDHFDLFGLRQVWCYFRQRTYRPPEFQTPGLYSWVRHPLMLGLLLVLWARTHMTAGDLLFSSGMSLYILIGICLEERDLLKEYGERYDQYRRQVPMIWPRLLPR